MSQTYNLPTSSNNYNTAILTNINQALETLRSDFSGANFPTNPAPVAGQVCYKNGVAYRYDGTNWIPEQVGWLLASKYATLSAAITAIGSTQVTLIIDTAINASNTAEAVIVPATLALMPISPGVISKNTATSLTINSAPVGNPMHQWLSGFAAGDVKFGDTSISMVFPEWWGAKSDGATDCYSAIMSAVKAFTRSGKVKLGRGIYKITNTIDLGSRTQGTVGLRTYLEGIDDCNTIIVHTGTQTTGAIYQRIEATWNGSSYVYDTGGLLNLTDLSVGTSYGNAVTVYCGGFEFNRITAFAAGATYSTIKIAGSGGRMNRIGYNSSQSPFSNSPYHADVVALLPLGVTSLLPQNNLAIVSTTYNDGTHGAEVWRPLEVWTTNSGSGDGSIGPSILIGLENGATGANPPSMIYFMTCKFTSGDQIGGGNEPPVIKINAGSQIYFDHCNAEPASQGGVMTSIEIDAIEGNTEVYLSNCFQESVGYIDVGDISDTTTTRTYTASLHVDHSNFYGIRLNSKMVTDGDILDLIVEDSIFNADITNLVGAKGTVPNLKITDSFYGARIPIGPIWQTFLLYIYNDTGTIKHLIGSDQVNQGVAYYATRINGAVNTPTVTPTATDTSTAMAGGGKISSTNVNRFVLDNAKDQVGGSEHAVSASIEHNDTTIALVVSANQVSRNVNGTTRKRIELFFSDSTTGAAYDLTTIGADKGIMVRVSGYMF